MYVNICWWQVTADDSHFALLSTVFSVKRNFREINEAVKEPIAGLINYSQHNYFNLSMKIFDKQF